MAIIGSGPAGLTAGYKLAVEGYDVTIYEASPVAGGGLAVYIPEYRVPKDVLEIDIENIKKSGVNILTDTRAGKDISFKEIRSKHKAVFMATGAQKSKKMNIENGHTEGVIEAVEFLKAVRANLCR